MKGSISTAAYAEVKTQLCKFIILLSINKECTLKELNLQRFTLHVKNEYN